MIISSCIHIAASGIISLFLWPSSIPLYLCTTSLFIHLSMDIYVVSMSGLLWIELNIGVPISLWVIVLSEYMARSGISGSHGNSIFCFLFYFKTSCRLNIPPKRETAYMTQLSNTFLMPVQTIRSFTYTTVNISHNVLECISGTHYTNYQNFENKLWK